MFHPIHFDFGKKKKVVPLKVTALIPSRYCNATGHQRWSTINIVAVMMCNNHVK